jgi:hypothetical protein
MTCFGDSIWDADILLHEPPVEISFRDSQEIIDWCWARRLRVVPEQEQSDWKYKGKPLQNPPPPAHLQSRAQYDEAMKHSCLGY